MVWTLTVEKSCNWNSITTNRPVDDDHDRKWREVFTVNFTPPIDPELKV